MEGFYKNNIFLENLRDTNSQQLKKAILLKPLHFFIKQSPKIRASKPEVKNVLRASFGVQTIGSPLRLKLVFKTTGIPVIFLNSSIKLQYKQF